MPVAARKHPNVGHELRNCTDSWRNLISSVTGLKVSQHPFPPCVSRQTTPFGRSTKSDVGSITIQVVAHPISAAVQMYTPIGKLPLGAWRYVRVHHDAASLLDMVGSIAPVGSARQYHSIWKYSDHWEIHILQHF